MRLTVRKTMIEVVFALIFIWMFSGCASQPMSSTPKSPPALATEVEYDPAVKSNIPVIKKPMPSEQGPDVYVHEVRWSGETISVIAQWYTGKQSKWEQIVKVNSDLDPKRMEIGDKILIPLALLKTREPMPRKYIGTPARKKEAPSSFHVKPAIESHKEKVVKATKTGRWAAKVDKIKLYQPKTIERSAEKLDAIELFQPESIEKTVAGSGEVELFQPID